MAFPKRLAIGLAFLLFFGGCIAEFDVMTELANIPQCGLLCLTEELPNTNCSLTDLECMCTNANFFKDGQICVVQNCTAEESLAVNKVQAKACNTPNRSRKNNIMYLTIIDVPTWLCAVTRLVSRWLLSRWALDDWVFCAVTVLYTVFMPLGKYTSWQAFGVEIWTLEYSVITQALKQFYVNQCIYLAGIALTKVSMLLFYLRIFPEKRFRALVYASLAIVAVPATVFIFLQLFQCRPISLAWTGWLLPYYNDRCVNVHTIAHVAAGFNIFQDLVVLLLPIRQVYQLQMQTRTKWGVYLMFGLGIFITIVSCVRVPYIVNFGRTYNPTWDYEDVFLWSGLEFDVTIIVACLPALAALYKHIRPRFSNSRSHTYVQHESSSHRPHRERKSQTPDTLRQYQEEGRTEVSRTEVNESQEELDIGVDFTAHADPVTRTRVVSLRGVSEEELNGAYSLATMGIRVDTVTTVTRTGSSERDNEYRL